MYILLIYDLNHYKNKKLYSGKKLTDKGKQLKSL
jgi:hypothetical protein